MKLFSLCRELNRQGAEEAAEQTTKSAEEGSVRGGEEECREGEAAEEPEKEKGG